MHVGLLELGQSTKKRVHRFPAGNWKNAVGIPLKKNNMKNGLRFPHKTAASSIK